MKNESSKNDLLKEIVNLSNSNMDNLDLMIDTSKFGHIMKDFQQMKKSNSMKQIKTKNVSEFNFDQALSDKQKENLKNEKDENSNINNRNLKTDDRVRKQSIQEIKTTNNIFDEADDILNNFNKNLKINKSLSINIERKLNPILEENENLNDDRKQEKNVNFKEIKNNQNNEIEKKNRN